MTEPSPPAPADPWPEELPTLAAVERAHIERVIAACDGKIIRAARVLGVARATLYRRLREYGAER